MIPIGDSPRARVTPWVTWAIIAVNLVVFLRMLTLSNEFFLGPEARGQAADLEADCYGFEAAPTETNDFVCRWSFQPREWFDTVQDKSAQPQEAPLLVLASVVTALFLHAGWLHILGNMLFLWVFGDNVEDRLGHMGFLLFYLASGIVASIVHGMVSPDSVVPVVGASGAVAGVLGAYLVWYPTATVNVVIPFFILIFIPLPIPAAVMIVLWFLQNLIAGLATVTDAAAPDAGTAFFAHIGGFLFGAGFVWLFLRGAGRRGRDAPRWGRS